MRLIKHILHPIKSGIAKEIDMDIESEKDIARSIIRAAGDMAKLNQRMIAASAKGESSVVRGLVREADCRAVDEDGNTALHMAALKGKLECVLTLLPFSDADQVNAAGRTALHMAAFNSNVAPEVIALLSHRCDPNIQDRAGMTAGMVAAQIGYKHADQLVAMAKPGLINAKGQSAADIAADARHHELSTKVAAADASFNKPASAPISTPTARPRAMS
jgi:ankyrin repeat protein